METPQASVATYLLGGFLFFGTGVLLLFHCSSMSHRKRHRKVKHSLDAGSNSGSAGSDGVARGRSDSGSGSGSGSGSRSGSGSGRQSIWAAWRNSRKKRRMVNIMEIPSITIVITPPSPTATPRSSVALDNLSIATTTSTSSEISHTSVTAFASEQQDGDVTALHGNDVSVAGGDAASPAVPFFSSSSSSNSSAALHACGFVVSTTSLRGISDVKIVTEDGESDFLEDDEALFYGRPRLASMDSSVRRSDFRILAKHEEDS